MSDLELDLLALYRALHEGLNDMIKKGRLNPADFPDDYQWLIETLEGAAAQDALVQQELADENENEDEDS